MARKARGLKNDRTTFYMLCVFGVVSYGLINYTFTFSREAQSGTSEATSNRSSSPILARELVNQLAIFPTNRTDPAEIPGHLLGRGLNKNNNTLQGSGIYRHHGDTVISNTDDYNSDPPFKERHFMTITSWTGRLGNHMFKYASLRGIASQHGYTTCVGAATPIAQFFDVPNIVSWLPEYLTTVKESRCFAYDRRVESLEHTRNYSIDGYLQSWRYFHNISGVVRRALTIKDRYNTEPKRFLSNISRRGLHNACIHVRRGDMLQPSVIGQGYTVASPGYINASMTYILEQVKAVQFIVVSDDMICCRSNIRGDDVIYSQFGNSPTLDMALLSLCDHVVLTSGSFVWWGGAWLAGGRSVYYGDFPRPGSGLDYIIDRTDYYPPHWVGLL